MKYLIVDDCGPIRRLVRRALRQAGPSSSQILEASNGEDALDIVRIERPDIVFCDWKLPGISGMEVLEALRKEGDTTAFGFVTTNSDPSSMGIATRTGASFYILKPFRTEDFEHVLKQINAAREEPPTS